MLDRLLNLFSRDSLALEVGVILVVTLALSLATRGNPGVFAAALR